MTLTLRAVSLNEQPLTQPIGAHFDGRGGTIGRHDDNTLALPDPERHISRRHAEIRSAGDGYTIRNVGSANPILVRGQPLARGEATTLSHRDEVRIGRYLLEVLDDQVGEEETTVARGPGGAEARAPATPHALPPSARDVPSSTGLGGLLADLAAPASGNDPFADLLPPAAGVAVSSAAWGAIKPAQAAAKLPDDFDPFAPPPPPEAVVTHPVDAGGGAFADLIPVASAAPIDSVAPLPPGAGDALADFLAGPVPSQAGQPVWDPAGGVSTDPMQALFGKAARAAPEPSSGDDTPELRSAFLPPAVQELIPTRFDRQATAATPSEPAEPAELARAAQRPSPGLAHGEPSPLSPPSRAAECSAAQIWAGFCEGAGVQIDVAPTPELMRRVGSLLRIAVDGTLRLMEVRRTTKHELRAEVTVIQSRNNNPLKFSPDAQVALEQLLKPPVRGFMPGPAAMTDAMHDLVGHSIGTMAGTRAALEGVLDRFAPGELESKLEGRSMLDSVLPMNRKARLWDLYLHKFEALRAEAKDDFDRLFGKAFVAAYEQQLERLEREQSGTGRAADA